VFQKEEVATKQQVVSNSTPATPTDEWWLEKAPSWSFLHFETTFLSGLGSPTTSCSLSRGSSCVGAGVENQECFPAENLTAILFLCMHRP